MTTVLASREAQVILEERDRLRADLLHAYDRIAAASEVLGQAAERARAAGNATREVELLRARVACLEYLEKLHREG